MKRGRHLAPIACALLREAEIGATIQHLEGLGFRLPATTRPYVTQTGFLRVRLVLRRRGLGDTHVIDSTLRGPLPGDLLDAIIDAIEVRAGA